MTDDRPNSIAPPLDERALRHLPRVGGAFAVAGDDGVSYECRATAVQGDVISASTRADGLVRGSRLSARVHDGVGVLVLVFVAEEVEPTTGGRADVLLHLVQTVERGDERHEERVAVDAQGTAAALEPLDLAVAGRPLPMTLVEASRTGLAFIVSRRLEAGEAVDLAFDDGSGVTVRCRAAVLRVERAVYGRHRYAARITAMGQLDQIRLDRMVGRAAAQHLTADATAHAGAAPAERGGSLRRLLRRA